MSNNNETNDTSDLKYFLVDVHTGKPLAAVGGMHIERSDVRDGKIIFTASQKIKILSEQVLPPREPPEGFFEKVVEAGEQPPACSTLWIPKKVEESK